MSRATRRFKVTLVGLGRMGRRHARVLCALRDRFEVVGTYDVGPEAQPFENIEPLGSDTEAVARGDVVVVATPVEAHAKIAARALAAGRHVLVEKPLCANADDAYRLVASARKGGARLFVGHSERFNPVVRALARLLRGQQLVSIDLRRVGPSRPNAGSALVSFGVHDFDLVAYLGGGEVVFQSALGTSSHDSGEDFAHVLFHIGSGGIGHLHVDRCAPERQRTLVLATQHWVYEGDLLAHRLVRTSRRTSGPECARTEVPLPLEEPLHAQAIALADALDGSAARELATGLDGARAVELAERAVAQVACAPSTGRAESLRRGPR
ncbi:MAG TPA: Gfo/Idh/MocA family oxidoreductase [Polyangiaceae bacterium]|nr:Gfo/Idh/MocA family oxidoreductase [Polyangiaceae bacterium]